MPGPEAPLALLAVPALLALALVISVPWRIADSQLPPNLWRELDKRQEDLRRLAASVQERARSPSGSRVADAELLGCAELSRLVGMGVVGTGITKMVLRAALLPSGEEIALKSVYWAGSDVSRCVQLHGHPGGCYQLAAYKLLKETILLRSLDHPGIIKLRGQCYNNSKNAGLKVVSLLELGAPLEMIRLLQIPWEERFKICLDLVELLYYLANSPLGPIALLDFQPRQFVMVNGILKVTDLDDVSTEELACKRDKDCMLVFPTKTFFLKCASHGICKGINEKRNLFNAYRYFFTYLLPHTAPFVLQPILNDILNATEYIVVKGPHNMETEDYRCWPSYSPSKCMLSVHNIEEAASFCSYHPQCQNFIITPQRTWTGRPLAVFQSNLTDLFPGSTTVAYIKKPAASRGTL